MKYTIQAVKPPLRHTTVSFCSPSGSSNTFDER